MNKIIGSVFAIITLVFILKVGQMLTENYPDFMPNLVTNGVKAIRGG